VTSSAASRSSSLALMPDGRFGSMSIGSQRRSTTWASLVVDRDRGLIRLAARASKAGSTGLTVM